MDNKSKEHHQGQAPSPSTLTVENVTKLELHYEYVDGDLRKVEEYIRKSQHFEQQQRSALSSHPILQPKEAFKNSGTDTAEDSSLDGKEKEIQISSEPKRKSKVPVATCGRKPMVNTEKCLYNSVQTQTEWSLSALSPGISGNGLTETEDRNATVSAASSLKSRAKNSVTIETPLESKTVDSEDGEHPGSAEITLSVEEYPLREVSEDLVSCDFCLKPKKPFPSVEQVISEPSGMLFCCVKSQKLFQFMIMDTIKTHTPEETDGKIEILTKEAEDKNEVKEREFEEKHSDDSPPTTLHSSEDIKALNTLREELEKVNTKDYITSLSNHLISYGSLFVTEKITFSLESANDGITYMQSAEPDFHMVPNIDDFFHPVLDSGTIKMPEKIVSEFYNSGSSFLILFTDGTGQVLYPSGNIGILIARSKSAQLTFIVMEDMKHKPQIQAVFMSNGHAACYHLNGSLWVVLDPCGGLYLDENRTQQKQWAWWDSSQHVHAPPFQPITLKLNSNIEVKMLTQDRIFLTYTREKQKVTFNVGSKLMLKDPDSLSQLMSRTADAECYLCSKHLQISILLNNIRDLLRIAHSSHSTIKTMQEYVKQLQKSLGYITGLANKLSDSAEKQKNQSIQQNVTTVKKKPHRTPLLKTECNVLETKKGRRKGNGM